ncbi:MAG TPA: hypothetical protein VHT30_03695 [Acidimicrobiales bacterium]|jgi:hypothetical protein|nr:hypothetical protein [Acidimicrobiales bacterium]
MSLARVFPSWFHGFIDFYAGIGLIMVATYLKVPRSAEAVGVVVGIAILLLSLMTRYSLGLVKVLAFPVHSAGDYVAGVVLIGSPWVLGITHSAHSLTVTYVVFGAGLLLVSLLSDYRYGQRRPTEIASDGSDVNKWYRGSGYYVNSAPVASSGSANYEERGREAWRGTAEPVREVPVVQEVPVAHTAPAAPMSASDWQPDPEAVGGATVHVTKEELIAELMAMQQR